MRILLSRDIRIHHTVDIFPGLDVDAKLLEWGIDFDEDKRRALEYFRGLPNSFGVVKGPFGAGKTYLDVVISMLLLSLDKKILAVSSANNAADSFIRKLDDKLERLQRREITVVKKAVVRIHSPGTVFVVKLPNAHCVLFAGRSYRAEYATPLAQTFKHFSRFK